jgi:cytidine deaminase
MVHVNGSGPKSAIPSSELTNRERGTAKEVADQIDKTRGETLEGFLARIGASDLGQLGERVLDILIRRQAEIVGAGNFALANAVQSASDHLRHPRFMGLSVEDLQLVELGAEEIRRLWARKRHHVVSVLRGASGSIYKGCHLGTYIPCHSYCAEPAALQSAAQAGEAILDTIVAVRYDDRTEETRVIAPCGACRERFLDYGVKYVVIPSPSSSGLVKVAATVLLPYPYWKEVPTSQSTVRRR